MNKNRILFVVLFFVFGLLLVTTPTVHAQAITIAGTFRYADANPVSNNVSLQPIAFAKVEIWSFRPRTLGVWLWGLDATVSTDNKGSIAELMPFTTGGVVYAVRVFATNDAAVVWPNDALHTTPFYQEPGEPNAPIYRTASSSSEVLDFSFDFTDAWVSQHYNLAETVRHGFEYANARRDPGETDPIPPANVQPTSVIGTYYNPAVDTLIINSTDVFEDLVVLHEYAHFLEEQISSFGWIATQHDGCVARDGVGAIINSAEHAWMEGFAEYFPQSVNRFLPSGTLKATTGSGTMSTASLEGQPSACLELAGSVTSDAIENHVAGTLWDLFDQPGDPGSVSESHDTISRQDLVIFQILDKEMDTYGTPPTISHFHNAWVLRGLDHPALDRIFVKHNIPEPASPPLFAPNQEWTEEAFYGDRGTFFADVDGDGKADAIVVNDNRVVVRPSTGSNFAPNQEWTEEAFYGDRGTFFADVDGDGKADAIVVNDNRVVVRPSTGSNFASNQEWTEEAYYGDRGTFFADVNGDRKADAIVVNDNRVVVRPSTGSNFAPNEEWTEGAYYGDRGTFFADVNGDGKADAIVVNDERVVVRPSTSSSFASNEEWTQDPYYGDRGTFFADVNGDGKTDAIVVNNERVVVRLSR